MTVRHTLDSPGRLGARSDDDNFDGTSAPSIPGLTVEIETPRGVEVGTGRHGDTRDRFSK